MNCRGCNYETKNIFDFGDQYLAGDFFCCSHHAQNAKKYPLRLNICRVCSLLQIEEIPELNDIFNDDYRYRTGDISDLVRHFKDYADWISKNFSTSSSILEFGCNDGTLLQFLSENGFTVKGMDPSENVVQFGISKGLDIDIGFFGTDSSIYRDEQFDLITCSNVYAHAPKIKLLTLEAARILKKNGIFLIEVHNAEELLPDQFDSIYHEHSVYYDIFSITNHLNANGFTVIRSCKTSMHGSGLRITAKKVEGKITLAPNTSQVLAQINKAKHIDDKLFCINMFMQNNLSNKTVDIYGVAGRAQMFYHMTNLGEYINRAFDDSAMRQGRFIVGTKTIISEYANETGDVLLITSWNYAESIFKKVSHNYKEVYTILPTIKRWK